MKRLFPTSFYNPVTLVGAAIASVSFGLILFLMVLELLDPNQKPYMGVIAFVILPGVLLFGVGLIILGIIRQHRRERLGTAKELHLPVIDLNKPDHRTAVVYFSFGTILLLIFSAFGSFKAYEYTETDAFCGEICHKVMEPEYAAYQLSPHARVGCVECHIGPGAGWFVRSKLSGAYQVYATVFDKYPRPIPTPIENLRPAQETCEQCHWPQHFFSEKQRNITNFISDEHNTMWNLTLLMKTGGGNIETGPTSGIHWHMNITNEVTYVAIDRQRMEIPWVQVKSKDGITRVYRDPDVQLTEEELAAYPRRRMDCIDCHNRPTHIYHPPMRSVNQALEHNWIDRSLPYIKSIGVRLLEQPYTTRRVALDSIRLVVEEYYRLNYPAVYSGRKRQIETAVNELQKIYRRNYFPEMKHDWREFPDHIGHMFSPGCFRCHNDRHVSDDGKVLSKDCNACHTIMAQGYEREKLRVSLAGVEYEHPIDIGGAWKTMNCSDCHSATK